MTRVPALLRGPERRAQPSSELERVLVPFDGSRAAQCALRHAIAKGTPGRVHIDLLNVQPAIMAGDVSLLTSAGAIEADRNELGMAVLQPALAMLQAHHVSHSAHVVLGDIPEEIAGIANRSACTKIVMGTRAMSALRSLFSRSVVQRVVKLTTVPVTLVKAGAATRKGALPVPAPTM